MRGRWDRRRERERVISSIWKRILPTFSASFFLFLCFYVILRIFLNSYDVFLSIMLQFFFKTYSRHIVIINPFLNAAPHNGCSSQYPPWDFKRLVSRALLTSFLSIFNRKRKKKSFLNQALKRPFLRMVEHRFYVITDKCKRMKYTHWFCYLAVI